MKGNLLSFFFLLLSLQLSSQQHIHISNLESRKDVDGNFIDVHDGRVIRFGDAFYWYGTSYGTTSGFVRSNHYQCYRSKDLMHWKKVGPLLKDQPSGIYYRPHVIYNQSSKKYVLWYNWYPKLWEGRFGVAIADHPEGPFTIVNDDVKVANSKLGVGDFGIFVDDDQTAYLSYNTISGHKASVEKLSPDFLSSTMENGGFITENCEAGTIFKRQGIYYLLTDYTCCFCTQGTGVRVYTSDHPLRGYQLRNNINRYPGTPAFGLVDGRKSPNLYTTVKKKEGVFPTIQLNFKDAIALDQVRLHQFTGNRRGVCGDTLIAFVHDTIDQPLFSLQIQRDADWIPISTETNITKLGLRQLFNLHFPAIMTHSLRIMIDSTYLYDQLQLNEIELFRSGSSVSLLSKHIEAFINDLNPTVGRPIVPAQQTFIMPLETPTGTEYIYMGDLWGSAPDNIKGHDIQYWSPPLQFDNQGNILPMKWTDEWQLIIK